MPIAPRSLQHLSRCVRRQNFKNLESPSPLHTSAFSSCRSLTFFHRFHSNPSQFPSSSSFLSSIWSRPFSVQNSNSEPSSSSSTNSSPSDSKSDSSKSSSTSKPSIFDTLKQELRYLKEHSEKYSKPAASERKFRRPEDVTRAPLYSVRAKALEEEAAAKAASEGDEPTESEHATNTDLVLIDHETVWDKRLEKFKNTIATSFLFSKARRAKRELAVSDNPVVSKVRDVLEEAQNTKEDMKLTWETSQHPLMDRIRNVSDKVMGESESGYALGELLKEDPQFDMLIFLEDMSQYMIPVVIKSFLQGDAVLLRNVTEGQAAHAVWQSIKEREARKVKWDDTILDVSRVDVDGLVISEGVPYIKLHFVVQTINCVRRAAPETTAERKVRLEKEKLEDEEDIAAGKPVRQRVETDIVEGHVADIQSSFYVWVVRRDFDNPDFDWKISEMQFQRIHALV